MFVVQRVVEILYREFKESVQCFSTVRDSHSAPLSSTSITTVVPAKAVPKMEASVLSCTAQRLPNVQSTPSTVRTIAMLSAYQRLPGFFLVLCPACPLVGNITSPASALAHIVTAPHGLYICMPMQHITVYRMLPSLCLL